VGSECLRVRDLFRGIGMGFACDGTCDGPYTAGAHVRLQAEVREWLM
jgi:hypothetical protein